jgi:hypothetical protein
VVPAMILAAQATDLCHGDSFNLQDGLRAFLAAYTTPKVVNQAFNSDAACTATKSRGSEWTTRTKTLPLAHPPAPVRTEMAAVRSTMHPWAVRNCLSWKIRGVKASSVKT